MEDQGSTILDIMILNGTAESRIVCENFGTATESLVITFAGMTTTGCLNCAMGGYGYAYCFSGTDATTCSMGNGFTDCTL